MYNTSNNFKLASTQDNRVINTYIEYPDITISASDILMSIDYYSSLANDEKSSYIGSFAAKKIKYTIDTDNSSFTNISSINKQITVYEGMLISGSYEYVPMGTYIVTKEDYDLKTRTSTIEALDFSILFDVRYYTDWIPNSTFQQFAEQICNEVGVELGSTSWFKSNTIIPEEPFFANNYREAISKIAEATLTFATRGKDNKLYFKKFTEVDFVA